MQAIANALRGHDTGNSHEALRVIDIIFRQHAAKQGCCLVTQSFFNEDAQNFTDLGGGGGGVGCRGFHTSFHTSQGGSSLNLDVSTTIIVKPRAIIDFLIANQNLNHPEQIYRGKAKRMLKIL